MCEICPLHFTHPLRDRWAAAVPHWGSLSAKQVWLDWGLLPQSPSTRADTPTLGKLKMTNHCECRPRVTFHNTFLIKLSVWSIHVLLCSLKSTKLCQPQVRRASYHWLTSWLEAARVEALSCIFWFVLSWQRKFDEGQKERAINTLSNEERVIPMSIHPGKDTGLMMVIINYK